MPSSWRYIKKHKQYTENNLRQCVLKYRDAFRPCSRVSSGYNNAIYTSLKRAFRSEIFLLGFLAENLINLKTNFIKFEVSTTFRSRDLTVLISPQKGIFPSKILPGLPTTNKISKSYRIFVTFNKCFCLSYCQNKVKGQNFKLPAFPVNLSQLAKS